MSLGFIVAVVFAIVLLSLALIWLRSYFEQLLGLTDDLTQQAQITLRETFRETTASFSIWPSQYKLAAGKGLVMAAGIENEAPDGKDHRFVINIIPTAADNTILSGYNCQQFVTCTDLKTKMERWLTYNRQPFPIQIGAVDTPPIKIVPDGDSIKGTYIFDIFACYDKTLGTTLLSSQCNENSQNLWGGSAEQLLITVV